MLKKKITRREFLKTGFVGILILLTAPLFRMFGSSRPLSGKEAKYYKNLAG